MVGVGYLHATGHDAEIECLPAAYNQREVLCPDRPSPGAKQEKYCQSFHISAITEKSLFYCKLFSFHPQQAKKIWQNGKFLLSLHFLSIEKTNCKEL
jgi:hypothetical protein